MKIQFPTHIEIASFTLKVLQDPESGGGKFDLCANELIIGTKYLKSDPDYTFMIICHEVQEICHVATCTRYNDPSVEDDFKFFMSHKEFSTTTSLFAKAIKQFIK